MCLCYIFIKNFQVPEAVPYDLPELCNLKHLEMEINLFDDDRLLPCAAFLRACPSLYKFTLKVKCFFLFTLIS